MPFQRTTTDHLIGQRFGRLTVLGVIYPKRKCRLVCRCDCGAERTPLRTMILSGRTTSCGCWRTELIVARRRQHGLSNLACDGAALPHPPRQQL
jgi:hypothetical protein